MASYEAIVDEDGRIRLPAELTDKVGARPGDRLDVTVLSRPMVGDHTRSLSLRVFSPAAVLRGRRSGAGELDALKAVARRARADGVRSSDAEDPIGDFLIEEDERSRGR